jgi:hypothetical protein
MVFVLIGVKGSGKTKQMIELINQAVDKDAGTVLCLEYGQKLTYDLHHNVRLIDSTPYEIGSYQILRGFITGLCASNYDLHQIFIDSLFKVAGNSEIPEAEKFLAWCERFSEVNDVSFTISISAPLEAATPAIRKYLQ